MYVLVGGFCKSPISFLFSNTGDFFFAFKFVGGVVTAKAVCCGSNKVIAVINNSGEGICQNNKKGGLTIINNSLYYHAKNKSP